MKILLRVVCWILISPAVAVMVLFVCPFFILLAIAEAFNWTACTAFGWEHHSIFDAETW